MFRMLLGVGESIYLPGGTKIVSMLFASTERGLPCGLFDFGTRMGLVLGGLIIPWLLVHLGWRSTFRLIGFSALLWVIPWLWATRGRLAQQPRTSSSTRSRKQEIRFLLTNRNLIGICLGFFCFDYYWYLFVTWLPDYLVTVRHFTILHAGFFLLAPLFRIWSQRTGGRLDRGPVDRLRLGRNPNPQGNCHRSVSLRLIADSRVPRP